MSESTRTHIDPSLAQPGAVQTKQCISCWGQFPIAFFSYNKYKKDGYHVRCKQCHSQRYRLERKIKYNAKSRTDIDDSIVRNVVYQNNTILQTFLGMNHSCIGYCPHDDRVFKVVFGKGSLGMDAMALFDMTGSMFREYHFSGGTSAQAEIMAILTTLKLRLEKTEADAIVSKQHIYLGTLNVGDPISKRIHRASP